MEIPCHCNVVIIGGGVSGASAAYHLAKAGVQDIIVLEAGDPGNGQFNGLPVPSHTKNKCDDEKHYEHALRSGTAVMSSASTIKMMVRLFASSADDFIKHHGKDGARRYLALASQGLQYQKDLASKVLPSVDTQIRSLGSLYLAFPSDADELKREFDLLKELGCEDVEWWPRTKLRNTPGCPTVFECAIYFPTDAIINSCEYAKGLLRNSVDTGCVSLFQDCPQVVNVSTHGQKAIVELATGACIISEHAVVATGGLFADRALFGILRPCWSYLVSVPHPSLKNQSAPLSSGVLSDGTPVFSHNMFTWGFTHDWCWTNGCVRISGEDHYSALKGPRYAERCQRLAAWVKEMYPSEFKVNPQYGTQYGVYSETPDSVPIIGHPNQSSRVCYLLGCNAWGQAVMSYAATLVPGLLGFADLSNDQRDILSLFTIRRFSLLPVVQSSKL